MSEHKPAVGKTVVCPECKGQGECYVSPIEVGEPQPGEYQPCELCEGTGQIEGLLASEEINLLREDQDLADKEGR
jgi:DnaJ-class molecular chaperone